VTSSEQPQQTTPGVVDKYQEKESPQQEEQEEQQQTLESNISHRRTESDYSIDSLSKLFNAGEDATPRYILAR